MKKLILSLTIILSLIVPTSAYALTATPTVSKHTTLTPSPSAAATDNKLETKLNDLKEKIASRVAELNLVEKRGIIAVVSGVSGNQVTVTDISGKTRFVDVDEITKFSSPNNKNFGLSDLTKGVKISVLGLYNKESQRLLARFIATTVDPSVIAGSISDIDKENYTLTVITENNKKQKIDIETATKTSVYSKDNGLSRSGFSKLSIGDRLQVICYPDKKDPTLLVADRIISFPDLPKDPKIVISQPEPSITDDIKPATGSGKKLTPIKK